MSFSHRLATQGFSRALRRCAGGGMIVMPLFGVSPSLKANKNHRVSEAMHATEDQEAPASAKRRRLTLRCSAAGIDKVHASMRRARRAELGRYAAA
jgi:hypothetical protein